MSTGIKTLSAISLFVDDLAATTDFYIRVFAVPIVFQDENSAVAKFDNLLVNLLKVESAAELVEPAWWLRKKPARASSSASGSTTSTPCVSGFGMKA